MTCYSFVNNRNLRHLCSSKHVSVILQTLIFDSNGTSPTKLHAIKL